MSAVKIITKKAAISPKGGQKVTLDDVWKTIDEIGKAQKKIQKAYAETATTTKETRRMVGDLGNKFGDEAECTPISGLQEKFKQFGFDFDTISRNKKINNKEHDLRAVINAFLEKQRPCDGRRGEGEVPNGRREQLCEAYGKTAEIRRFARRQAGVF